MGCPSRRNELERCRGCSGEDYPCCELYIEDRYEQTHPSEHDDYDDLADDYEDTTCDECGEELDTDCNGELRCPNCDGPCPCCDDGDGPDLDESMDGDFDTGMASAGLGMDEDYSHDTSSDLDC